MVCCGQTPDTDLRHGIARNRVCRDVYCTVLFALFWVGMFVVAVAGFQNGDPRLLVIPRDNLNSFCGINNVNSSNPYANQTGKPVLYYLDPFAAAQREDNLTFVCLSACPNVTTLTTPETAICEYGPQPANISEFVQKVQAEKCSPYTYKSKPLLHRCIPLEAIPPAFLNNTASFGNTTVSVNSLLTNGRDTAIQAVADLYITWPFLAVGSGTAVVLSFLWLFFAHFFVGAFVWFTIIATNLVFMVGTAFLYLYWNSRKIAYETNSFPTGLFEASTPWGSFSKNIPYLNTQTVISAADVRNSMISFIIILVFTVIIFLVSIAMIKRVRMAIEIIKEASQAFLKMPSLTIMPLFFSIAMIALFTYFIVVMVYLATPSGPVTIGILGRTFSDKNTSRYMIWYHIAGFIWTYYTILGIAYCTVAGAVGEWYWSKDKSQIMKMYVLNSFTRTMFYHLGSIILGSLLITIVELIRLVLYQLQKQVSTSQNPYLKYVVACAQCCMKMVQVIMKFVNKNAYIYIAITGKSFFSAASSATALLLKNAAKTIAVTYVTNIVLFFTKLAVVGVNCLAGWFILLSFPDLFPDISFPNLTVGLLGLETYLIVSVFFGNYEITIDTIFLSVLEDLDKNDGSVERPYMMTDSMRRIMSKKVYEVNIEQES